ncbi:SDR family NAD(P)-dependent oxidoreductase [Alloscardovia criceti]|uniref:SDR family NAD(P)-dependent oxidoreductase n=1 Tax=Alloscardovia criceti TaxID=356828 RepID=UPI00039D6376|nr:SDR family oxidoreductase [Alloscardovia criceti]
MNTTRHPVALITGASRGIGEEFAHIYAKNGYDLVLVARSEADLNALKKRVERAYPVRAYVYVQDFSQDDAAHHVADYLAKEKLDVDALVNNAGFGDFGYFWEGSKDKQLSLLHVNIIALVHLTRLIVPGMVARGRGHVLNVASIAASSAGPKMALYYASKAFVLSFSEALQEELKGTGVTSTALCPGPTRTNFEATADLKNSHMFTWLRPATAKKVAEIGYRAAQRGKAIQFAGITPLMLHLMSRVAPRSLSRKFARLING